MLNTPEGRSWECDKRKAYERLRGWIEQGDNSDSRKDRQLFVSARHESWHHKILDERVSVIV